MQHRYSGIVRLTAATAVWVVTAATGALACLNDGTEEGHAHSGNGYPHASERRADDLRHLLKPPLFDTAAALKRIEQYEAQGLAALSQVDRHRYGIALVELERYAEARDWWLRLEQENPGEYETASNLGTAYELTGENTEALEWIKAGIARNPYSHHGTEWLHVRILEAKLAMEADPDWTSRNRVLGLDFGDGEWPVLPAAPVTGNAGAELDLTEVRRALEYQLGERTKFIRRPEPIVAQLLTDLGNVLLLEQAYPLAVVAFKRAQDYGDNGPLTAARLAKAQELGTSVGSGLARLFERRTTFKLAAGLILLFFVLLILRAAGQRRSPAAAPAQAMQNSAGEGVQFLNLHAGSQVRKIEVIESEDSAGGSGKLSGNGDKHP